MLKNEFYKLRFDGKELWKHYSDKGKYILQVETNIPYEEAIDVHPCKYTYIETDIDINPIEEIETSDGIQEEDKKDLDSKEESQQKIEIKDFESTTSLVS